MERSFPARILDQVFPLGAVLSIKKFELLIFGN